ncbi:MAG: putative toxin-antitoxin system toxin component, PIN family [Actinomycetota bacterium]|nr:putative toxin-antitoxin system toxin component, PIN family [Actinomycetota bacterium]
MVVDADCLIAGTLAAVGAARELLDLWEDGEFELIVCPQLIHEVEKSLLHPRIADKYGITADETRALAHRLSEEGLRSDDPRDPPGAVPDDPTDDYLIALTLSAEADFLVTRDRHFDKVRIEGLRIVSPGAMLRILEQ